MPNQTCKHKSHVSSPSQEASSKTVCSNPRKRQPQGKATGLSSSGITGKRTVASTGKPAKHAAKHPAQNSSSESQKSTERWKSAFRITAFVHRNKTRHIFQDAETLAPSPSVSLYEVYLSKKCRSPNSALSILRKLAHVFTWAKETRFDIEHYLLNGEAPAPETIRAFTHWLSENTPSVERYNTIVDVTVNMFNWFMKQYGSFEGISNVRLVHRELAVKALGELFRSQKKKCRKKKYADDLTEEQIATIEQYLKPENRKGVKPAVAMRDYLLWRIAIEFGMRSGEILALRLCDCPHEGQDFIKIVHIDERGPNYVDPRAPNHPRVKTLSRDLGFLLDGSPIPNLIGDYNAEYRTIKVKRLGRNVNLPPPYDFLILNHRRKSGMPLSTSGMKKIAQEISAATGIDFHWHLARHAFFNRAYADVMSHPDKKAKIMDLVEWGGWSDEKSLQLYVNRARRDRARMALSIWQAGKNKWEALQ